MNSNSNLNIGLNLFSSDVICSLVLAVAKLVGIANISWLSVFLPMIAVVIIDLVFLLMNWFDRSDYLFSTPWSERNVISMDKKDLYKEINRHLNSIDDSWQIARNNLNEFNDVN